MIRKLSELLGLQVEVLIQPYEMDGNKKQLNSKTITLTMVGNILATGKEVLGAKPSIRYGCRV